MFRIIPKDKFIVILFFAAILSGLFWGSKMLGQPLSAGGNEILYNTIAHNILELSSFTSDKKDIAAVSEPFYPVFLSGVYIIFGKDSFDAVRLIQILLFAFTVLIVYSFTKEIMDDRTAKIIGLLVALFFPLAANASQFTRETLFAFLLVVLISSLYKAERTLKIKWFVFSGIILGLAVLTNAVAQFFIIFVILGFFLSLRKDFFRKHLLLKLGLLTLFFILVIGAWSFRDFGQGPKALNLKAGGVLGRKAEMIESVRGEIYLRHLGGQLFGYYFFEKEGFNPSMLLGSPKTSKAFYGMLARGESVEEIGKKLSEESLQTIVGNLPRYFAISFLELLQFNSPILPNSETLEAAPAQNLFIKNSHPKIPAIIKIIILLSLRIVYWLFFGFMIYGLIRAVKDWKKFIWIILIILYFNLTYSALFGIPRYSIPIYPFYIVFFVYGTSVFLGRLKISKSTSLNVA